jgi:hypothetical protein
MVDGNKIIIIFYFIYCVCANYKCCIMPSRGPDLENKVSCILYLGSCIKKKREAVVVVIVWWLDLQLTMKSVPITTNVVSSNPAQARCTTFNFFWFNIA